MSLSDRDILELNELCGAVVDGTLTEVQRARLAAWLLESEAARRFYARALGQSASLHTYAGELHAGTPDATVEKSRWWRFWPYALPAAAALVLGGWFATRGHFVSAPAESEFVARLTGAKDARWAVASLHPGDRLEKNRRLELTAGLAEITFDSGARVTIEGPATLAIASAWGGTLHRGTLKASVPPEAIGFQISHPAVEVVDLGTEFTMIADGRGAAEVLVLKGEVEAAPRSGGAESILLRERESRRFAASGVSEVTDRERKFALLHEPLLLDRVTLATRLVHWSFDEADGALLRAVSTGMPNDSSHAQVYGAAPGEAVRVEGRRDRALRLDGERYARAAVPGLSSGGPHTIAFWVRVPEDAPLSEAYSIVTWATRSKKLGNRHAGINWNRDRTEGPLGALRTDFRGGHAIGSTSLRDGRWHHIAVCFVPGEDQPGTPVRVRHYVDGQLEGGTTFASRAPGPAVEEDPALADIVWIGRRLGPSGPRTERFRGDLDELFIADRVLEPHEIVSLMNDNRLPAVSLAAKE
ncbi:MAG: LamG-like jellyroll fold domain-containing protein [Opitutaceae bacterium]|nr:LamG-like jellyroll fold domain-containing protein [Opitutaceae bacterium]